MDISFFDYLLTDTEKDALFLEDNLIKKHQPKYNFLLKDDKTYPWICLKKILTPLFLLQEVELIVIVFFLVRL